MPIANYFPLYKGRYEVGPGLYQLGKNFGNGRVDQHLLQLDEQWDEYFQAKQRARNEDLNKYYICKELTAGEYRAICEKLIEHMLEEHPQYFLLREDDQGRYLLLAKPSQQTLVYDREYQLFDVDSSNKNITPYRDLLDALMCQLQEDISFVSVENGKDSIKLLHLCFPNHWSADAKIGRSFFQSHQVVPGMQKVFDHSQTLLQMLCTKGPFVRFAWGLSTDSRLNHHPIPPADVDPQQWRGRSFSRKSPQLFLRVERQCTLAFPELNGFIFTIRSYFTDVKVLSLQQLKLLNSALLNMSPESLSYKGLASDSNDIVDWLDELAQQKSVQ